MGAHQLYVLAILSIEHSRRETTQQFEQKRPSEDITRVHQVDIGNNVHLLLSNLWAKVGRSWIWDIDKLTIT